MRGAVAGGAGGPVHQADRGSTHWSSVQVGRTQIIRGVKSISFNRT